MNNCAEVGLKSNSIALSEGSSLQMYLPGSILLYKGNQLAGVYYIGIGIMSIFQDRLKSK